MVIEKYDAKWKDKFESIKEKLSNAIGDYVSIEHVGSTSVPGMYAKPIIDIDLAIKGKEDFANCKKHLEAIGYIHVGDQGIDGREVFKRSSFGNNGILDNIDHHLYVCEENNDEYSRHIKFKNMLIKNESYRNEYNEIKHAILEKVGNENREGYVEAKEMEYKWFFDKVISDNSNK